MLPKRSLVITVGTSLFSSASWQPKGAFQKIRGYGSSWCQDLLDKPSQRRSHGRQIIPRITELLRDPERELEAIKDFCWPRDGHDFRYSAELSTLLKWQGQERFRDSKTFLSERYSSIDLVSPAHPNDDAFVAAHHLQRVLTERIEVSSVAVREILTSTEVSARVEHFQQYLRDLMDRKQSVDVIVSGGYKVFAMSAAVAALSSENTSDWRVIYVHDGPSQELIVQSRFQTDVGGRTLKSLSPSDPM